MKKAPTIHAPSAPAKFFAPQPGFGEGSKWPIPAMVGEAPFAPKNVHPWFRPLLISTQNQVGLD